MSEVIAWSDILLRHDADKYVYRLYGFDGVLAGHQGPLVVFTRQRALDFSKYGGFPSGYWKNVGELIYSVE